MKYQSKVRLDQWECSMPLPKHIQIRNTQNCLLSCLVTWLVAELVVCVSKEIRCMDNHLKLLSFQWMGLLVHWEWMSMVTDRTPTLGVAISDHIKVLYQFCTMFMETHQEILYLEEIFQNMYLIFLNLLEHLQNHHPALVDDSETTTSRTPTSLNHLKRNSASSFSFFVQSDWPTGGRLMALSYSTPGPDFAADFDDNIRWF